MRFAHVIPAETAEPRLAVIDGDDAIADSTAIVTYLTDRAQQLTATPGTIARARQDAMTFRLLDEFDALMKGLEPIAAAVGRSL